ncbi:putative ABC transporter ATP-binding protein [Gordonia paraffinivorans NBRC 108238]|uniref:ABC transporter ATP-binding protein n=1 Tax=Gordonia paraffinivorans NBRC 108238 TaxID=1223543 RepID=A0ABQ0IQ79_9ACTN|nr:ATP-binding cassette domain-containing protein [Gordonia paraffinivorans]GAC85695.1 putative ABC transporter ATP-binding protein [Gordonia paraffinivorans NBRC 108238]
MGRHSITDDAPDRRASPYALELRGLQKTFRTGLFGRGPRVHALNGLDLSVPTGTVHALLGPNGAGKTTTVRAVATLMTPDEGSVIVDGVDAIADPGAVRKIVGVSGQYAAVDGNLTGFENLRMVGQLYGQPRSEASERARELIAELNLGDAADRPMRTYSGGMRRRLDLAGALINRPSLVILDEPTTGLDPRGRRQMWEVIAEQVGSGATVLLTTQYLEEADALADEITVIDHGTIRAQGSAAELKSATGGSILTVEVVVPQYDDADTQVSSSLTQIGVGPAERVESGTETVTDTTSARWSVPVDAGTRSAVAAVLALSAAGIEVVDASVSTPTLDDVFLTLTERSGTTGPDTLGGVDEIIHRPAGSDTATGEPEAKGEPVDRFADTVCSDVLGADERAADSPDDRADRSEHAHVH